MSLKQIRRYRVSCEAWQHPKSLLWSGDDLLDPITRIRYLADGSTDSSKMIGLGGVGFDRAIQSKDGRYWVVYQALGTKGVVFRDGRLIREINRSYYHADVYEYPVALIDLPDGGTGIVHCPQEYNRLEIEEIESGRCLTPRTGKLMDVFHSRLQVSPDSRYLLSAGWIWQPVDFVSVYSIEDALRSPQLLNECDPIVSWSDSVASFSNNDSLMFAFMDDDAKGCSVGRYDLGTRMTKKVADLLEPTGTIIPLGEDYFVGLYGHPKLFETSSGKVVADWPDIASGHQVSCIIGHLEPLPPLAFDSAAKRFAVGDATGLTVVQLG